MADQDNNPFARVYYHRATGKQIKARPNTLAFLAEIADLDAEAASPRGRNAIIRLPGIKRVTVKGRRYYYHRGTGKRIIAPPDTPDFVAEIEQLDAEVVQS